MCEFWLWPRKKVVGQVENNKKIPKDEWNLKEIKKNPRFNWGGAMVTWNKEQLEKCKKVVEDGTWPL